MATRYQFIDDSGETRLAGTLEPDPGGSTPLLAQAGAGSPLGSVTPTATGYLYQDTTNGALFVALGATSADWVAVGGLDSAPGGVDAVGVSKRTAGGQVFVIGPSGAVDSGVTMTDKDGAAGTGNALQWFPGAADGSQVLYLYLGSAGQYTHSWNADGTYTNSHGIIFPTSDPHVAGAWWDNAGVLTKSAG